MRDAAELPLSMLILQIGMAELYSSADTLVKTN
jgi:hypothetical protein